MKKQKISSAILAFGLAASLLFQVPVSAEEAEQTAAEATGSVSTNSISGWPQASDISSEAAVVMENTTNTILYSKNADEELFPGSTVKIMTCLLALENTQLTDQVTMTATGVSGVTDGGASISSQVDEVFTVEQCLYAIMVSSANDIALQIAEHVGGSVENFVQQMNTTAQKLGCTNTVFTNPTGLPDDQQHTTAHDMALIMQAAIQNEDFQTIAAATSYTIPATNKAAARNLTSKFTMTDTGSTGFYEGCIGGKEGYTEASGSTLVCAAKRNGMTLISVVLKGASGQTAPDAASILNYGFDNFTTLSLGNSDFSIISGGDVVVPAGTGEDSLTTEDTQNGDQIDRTYLFNGTAVGTAVLEIAQADDTESVQKGEQNMQAAKEYSENHTQLPYFLIAGVFLVLLIFLIWRIVKIAKS
nr:D-alanyl-D-alanine carboxypeptidase family protein [uncultured Blautia sp.]